MSGIYSTDYMWFNQEKMIGVFVQQDERKELLPIKGIRIPLAIDYSAVCSLYTVLRTINDLNEN